MGLHTIALVLCMVMTKSQGSYNVMDFGAAGDGKTDDSKAFVEAWQETCGSKSKNSTLIIPKGHTFLLKTVKFQGPCNSLSIHIQVLGDIIAPSRKSFGKNKANWLVFSKINGLAVNGNGQIDGKGSSWWTSCTKKAWNCKRPPALKFYRCNNLQIRGLRIRNSPKNHLSISACNGSNISNINITAPKTSPNTDGINISGSTNISVHDCFIGTGDDCIAVSNGSSYINITRINCGPGHGISIGSLGSNGGEVTVEEVHVSKCIFNRTQNGARIKTWQGGSGYAKKISFENITLIEAGNPIFIDQYYCPHRVCRNQTSAVEVSQVSLIGFHGTSKTVAAIQLNCSRSVGCSDIVLAKINITAATDLHKRNNQIRSTCINARGTSTPSNMPPIPCLLPDYL